MPDDAWLPVVAKRGWVVLTHNERIRYTPNERDAVMQNGLAMLIVTGKAPYPVLAQSLVRMMSKVEGFLGTGRH